MCHICLIGVMESSIVIPMVKLVEGIIGLAADITLTANFSMDILMNAMIA